MSFARAVLLVGAVGVSGSLGCGSYVPPPEQIPTFQIDTVASEVQLTGTGVDQDRADQWRSQIAWALTDMMRERPDLEDASAARFAAMVSYDINAWPMAACLGLLWLVGCPMSDWTVDVDLLLEVDGELYRGQGSYSYPASLYYNSMGHTATLGATERAVKDALSNAMAKKGQDAVAKRSKGEESP